MSSPFSHYKSVGVILDAQGAWAAMYPTKKSESAVQLPHSLSALCFHIYIVYSMQKATFLLTQLKITIFPFLILFKRIESIDMTLCVISFLVVYFGHKLVILLEKSIVDFGLGR